MTTDSIRTGGRVPLIQRLPYWERQYAPESTLPQRLFDLFFGILLPVVCVLMDPFVFTAQETGLQNYCYLFMGFQAMALGVWLLIPGIPKAACAVLSGVFLAGAIFSVIVAIPLFPLAAIGLMVLIGILGFSPFLSFFVFLRNSRRAAKQVGLELGDQAAAILVITGLGLSFLLPLFLGVAVNVTVMVPTSSPILF